MRFVRFLFRLFRKLLTFVVDIIASQSTWAYIRRHQLELDEYLDKELNNSETGLLYERQIGYVLESAGYHVKFHGALNGFNDLGADLIAYKGSDTIVVQAKGWSKAKRIHEKYIFQLFGTLITTRRTNTEKLLDPFFTLRLNTVI